MSENQLRLPSKSDRVYVDGWQIVGRRMLGESELTNIYGAIR